MASRAAVQGQHSMGERGSRTSRTGHRQRSEAGQRHSAATAVRRAGRLNRDAAVQQHVRESGSGDQARQVAGAAAVDGGEATRRKPLAAAAAQASRQTEEAAMPGIEPSIMDAEATHASSSRLSSHGNPAVHTYAAEALTPQHQQPASQAAGSRVVVRRPAAEVAYTDQPTTAQPGRTRHQLPAQRGAGGEADARCEAGADALAVTDRNSTDAPHDDSGDGTATAESLPPPIADRAEPNNVEAASEEAGAVNIPSPPAAALVSSTQLNDMPVGSVPSETAFFAAEVMGTSMTAPHAGQQSADRPARLAAIFAGTADTASFGSARAQAPPAGQGSAADSAAGQSEPAAAVGGVSTGAADTVCQPDSAPEVGVLDPLVAASADAESPVFEMELKPDGELRLMTASAIGSDGVGLVQVEWEGVDGTVMRPEAADGGEISAWDLSLWKALFDAPPLCGHSNEARAVANRSPC